MSGQAVAGAKHTMLGCTPGDSRCVDMTDQIDHAEQGIALLIRELRAVIDHWVPDLHPDDSGGLLEVADILDRYDRGQ